MTVPVTDFPAMRKLLLPALLSLVLGCWLQIATAEDLSDLSGEKGMLQENDMFNHNAKVNDPTVIDESEEDFAEEEFDDDDNDDDDGDDNDDDDENYDDEDDENENGDLIDAQRYVFNSVPLPTRHFVWGYR